MIGQWRRYWGTFWKLAQARNCYVILNSHLSNWGLVISQDQKKQDSRDIRLVKILKSAMELRKALRRRK